MSSDSSIIELAGIVYGAKTGKGNIRNPEDFHAVKGNGSSILGWRLQRVVNNTMGTYMYRDFGEALHGSLHAENNDCIK